MACCKQSMWAGYKMFATCFSFSVIVISTSEHWLWYILFYSKPLLISVFSWSLDVVQLYPMERVKVPLNSRCGILYPNNSKADQTMIETIEMTETKLLVQLWYAMVTTRERTEAPIDDDYEPNCASHRVTLTLIARRLRLQAL